jgi:thiol-disulfide isomerase/thioredoxin
MLVAILRGSQMGPREGWFGPAVSRYGWQWLAIKEGWDPAVEKLTREQFSGSDTQFRPLDRDRDGHLTPGDLDWSDKNPWVQQASIVTRLFRRMNARGDGRLTQADLAAFFERAAEGKDHLTVGDLRDVLLAGMGGGSAADEPSREVLVRGLLAGEVGSRHEGPALNEPAPDFTLTTADGQTTYQLSKLVGDKPVVLVFGNFTCGPFRALYPEVDDLHERYKDQAVFLMVYVREAHPLDGWAMESNAKANVAVKQPTTLGERTTVCTEFCQRLKPTLPVVVDTLDDAAGHAYSGMPARLYVIDRQGKVAYKSGRGPFGFKPAELEQSLVMALLEAAGQPAKSP